MVGFVTVKVVQSAVEVVESVAVEVEVEVVRRLCLEFILIFIEI